MTEHTLNQPEELKITKFDGIARFVVDEAGRSVPGFTNRSDPGLEGGDATGHRANGRKTRRDVAGQHPSVAALCRAANQTTSTTQSSLVAENLLYPTNDIARRDTRQKGRDP